MEAQVLQNGLPLTRPTRWSSGLKGFEEDGVPVTWKLFPGAANVGQNVNVTVLHAGEITPGWINVHAIVSVDRVPWQYAMPGQVFVDRGDWPRGQFSCIISYPILATDEYRGGVFTLMLRTIVEEAKTR